MPGLDEQFTDRENFYIAFKKLRHYLDQANEWYDPIALAEYEATLSTRIPAIIDELKEHRYQTRPLQPLPFPKKNKATGQHRLRPYFYVNLDDQLVWTAMVNVLSEHVEKKMPFWSYGNRLFRPVWFEVDPDTLKRKLIRGSCRNTSANLYRPWGQSWPLYKRHISMTIKIMAKTSQFDTTDLEDQIEQDIFQRAEDDRFYENRFLDKSHWREGQYDKLYWAAIDFKTFFPSIEPQKIVGNIRRYLRDGDEPRNDIELILETMSKMFLYQLDVRGWHKKDLTGRNGIGLDNAIYFHGLPTGLAVGGFLANVAMLDIDNQLTDWLMANKRVSLFKYVDDHVVLAQSSEELITFLNFYKGLLEPGKVSIQTEKIEPRDGLHYTGKNGFALKKRLGATELDVAFPNPLMTSTLKKVSHLNLIDFDLLDEGELDNIEIDLKHLLLTDFPETEIRKDTKMAFAAAKLCALGREIKPDFSNIDPTLSANSEIIEAKVKELLTSSENKAAKQSLIDAETDVFVKKQINGELKHVNRKHKEIFQMLLKAVRDNPDKIKLWKRCIEFCYFTGYNGLQEVLSNVENCEVHPASRSFLYGYLALNIQLCLIRCLGYLQNKNILFWKTYTCFNFVQNVTRLTDDRIRDNPRLAPFLRQSIRNLEISRQFVSEVCEKVPTSLALYLTSDKGFIASNLDIESVKSAIRQESYAWYLLTNAVWTDKEEFFRQVIPGLDLKKPLSWSILSLYPGAIDGQMLAKIRSFLKKDDELSKIYQSEIYNFRSSNGFTYEMFNHIRLTDSTAFDRYIKDYPKLKRIFSQSTVKYIRLNEWLANMVEQNAHDSFIDPRLSEWTLIEIVRQITDLVHKAMQGSTIFDPYPNKEYHLIHPANYLIPTEWLSTKQSNWEQWKTTVRKYRIKLANPKWVIDDYRYFPISSLWISHALLFFGSPQLPVVVGMSLLLVKLLSRSFTWPSTANKIHFIDEVYSDAYRAIEVEKLSSDTYLMLSSIFSKEQYDIFYNADFIKITENRHIKGLSDYMALLSDIQNRLEKQQLTIREREPRQLIYINIDELNGAQHKFFERL